MVSYIQKNIPILKNINPKELGYLRADGVIKFLTEETAGKFSKNKILQGLEQGKEILIISKGSEVLKSYYGTYNKVNFKIDECPPFENCTILHGHPFLEDTFMTLPFSPVDTKTFLVLNRLFGYTKSVVYNADGEQCTMRLPSIIKNNLIKKIPNFIKYLLTTLELKPFEKIIDEAEKITENPEKIKFHFNKIVQNNDNIKELLNNESTKELINSWLKIKISSLLEHESIQEYCQKIGIDYQTNFSNLR